MWNHYFIFFVLSWWEPPKGTLKVLYPKHYPPNIWTLLLGSNFTIFLKIWFRRNLFLRCAEVKSHQWWLYSHSKGWQAGTILDSEGLSLSPFRRLPWHCLNLPLLCDTYFFVISEHFAFFTPSKCLEWASFMDHYFPKKFKRGMPFNFSECSPSLGILAVTAMPFLVWCVCCLISFNFISISLILF